MKHEHDKCKYFSLQECPHINDKIMKLATQDTPQSYTGIATEITFPTYEEINKICSNCDSFTQK